MSTATIPSSTLTSAQIHTAACYLAETRDALIAATAGLSPAQSTFKPNPGSWSITGIVEHVSLIDDAVHSIVSNLGNATPPPPGWNEAEIDRWILKELPRRTSKISAPPYLCPTGNWPLTEALARFSASRQRCIGDLSTPSLRGRTVPHPVAGHWDGYQWLLAAGSHSARHTSQILEIKACPGFPLQS